MKKIALASAAMGGVALFAFGASGTFASFTDDEVATATAKAGSMDLQVGGPTGTTSADLGTLNPGGSKTVSYWISNVGDVAGVVSARLAVTDAENGCTDAESKLKAPAADDCSQWTTGGEFSKYATVQFLEASAANSVACASATDGNPVLGMAPVGLQAAQTGQIRVDDLTANENKCVVLKVVLPKDKAGNDVQGDTAEIKMNINLAQA